MLKSVQFFLRDSNAFETDTSKDSLLPHSPSRSCSRRSIPECALAPCKLWTSVDRHSRKSTCVYAFMNKPTTYKRRKQTNEQNLPAAHAGLSVVLELRPEP